MPPKILKSAAEIVKDAIKAVEAEKKAGKTGEILESRTAPATTPRGGTLLPRSQGMYPPDVPQVDLPRQKGVDKARAEGKKPKYTERMQSLLDSPTVRKKVDKLIAKGQDLGMQEWYGTEPLRQVALDVISPQQYESLMAQLASASQRNPVDQQNLMGSYLYYLQQQGKLDPEAVLLTNKLREQGLEGISAPLIEFPEGYGSLAQSAIFERGKQIASGDIAGALPPEKKLGTFYRNLLGNLQPVTVDVNAVRGPVIEAGDPRWLTSKLVEKDEAGKVKNVYFPRQMVEEGEMSIREARQRPGFWEAAPSGSEYAGFEDLWQRAARREGVAPAEAQALGWYGSADVTALKTKPELYVDNLERLLNRTAEVTGKSPLEVLRQFLKGEEFLKKAKGGSIDLEAEYRMGKGGAVLMKRGGKAKGETLASMDTGKVEMGRAPGAEKAERILAGAAEFIPGVAAGKSALEGEYQKALIEAGLDVAGGPLAKGLGAAIPAVAGIFIGPKSKLWNEEKRREWARLINAGVDEKEAYQKTGTFMGADGNVRQEISDQSMKMRSPEDLARLMDEKSRQAQAIKASMGYGSKQRDLFPKALTEARKRERPRLEGLEMDIKDLERDPKLFGVPARLAVDHPKLFEAYPELGDVMVRQNVDLGPGVYGSLSLGVEPKISLADPRLLDKEFGAPEDTMIHELQHMVQKIEGFEGGSSAQDAINMVGRARVKELMDQGVPKMDALDQARTEFKGRAGELYNRMAGEAEARAVEARRPMSSDELLQNFPPEQQYRDVYPYEEQLMQRDYPPVWLYNKGGPVKMAKGGDLEEEYNLRKMGMDPTRVRRGDQRKPLSRAEIQAMMLDVPAGLGVPFAEAGAYALRGETDEAKESAAIEAALMGIPAAAVLAKPAYRAVKKGVQKATPAVREAAYEALESAMESGVIPDPRMHIFIGPKSKLWDKTAAKEFAKLEKAGASPQEAWQQTGTFRSPDGILRQEISDQPSRLRRERMMDLEEEHQSIRAKGNEEHKRLLDAVDRGEMTKEAAEAEWERIREPLLDQRAQIALEEYPAASKLANPGQLIRRQNPNLSQTLYHPELFKAYPQLKHIRTEYRVDPSAMPRGHLTVGEPLPWSSSNAPSMLSVAPTTPEARNIILHEAQHGIQRLENMGLGGNPTREWNMLPSEMHPIDYLQRLQQSRDGLLRQLDDLAKQVPEGGFDLKSDEMHPLFIRNGALTRRIENTEDAILAVKQGEYHPLYQRMAGEAEARAVQKRMTYGPEYRREIFPLDEYDVPIDQLVVRTEPYANGGPVKMADRGEPTLREMGQPRYSTERKGPPGMARFTKDVLENLYQMAKVQAAEELQTNDSRAITDVANNIIADTVGAPVDMVNMALQSFGVGSERPTGGSQQLRDLMREYEMTSGVERPLTETLLSIAGPGAVAKGPRAAEQALNLGTAAVRRPFTPATVTMEAVAPDLAKDAPTQFKEYVTNQLLGKGSVPTLGGRQTIRRPGQGVYVNDDKELELNPMVSFDVPVRGALERPGQLSADIATLGADLGQESMAAHRFIPMATNQIKDASAMMITGPGGKPLTKNQVADLGERLPGMIVTHSPRLGGLLVAPYSITKGVIPQEFLRAQSVANEVLGKGAKIQYGRADQGKDLMYMTRDQYATSGARAPSVETQRKRAQLKRMEQSLPTTGQSVAARQARRQPEPDTTD